MKAFAVVNNQLRIYTVIGAENSHHAANKATKLWGNNWVSILPLYSTEYLYPQFVSIKEFNKRIKSLSEATKRETNEDTPL